MGTVVLRRHVVNSASINTVSLSLVRSGSLDLGAVRGEDGWE